MTLIVASGCLLTWNIYRSLWGQHAES
jgi:hypothetical protein